MTGKKATLQCIECGKLYTPEHATCPDDNSDLVPLKQDKLVGTEFGERYKILEIAGSGGMSVVYKARHKYIDRDVAIKILHHHLVTEATSVKRFQQEAKAASSLTHQNIISVYDFGVSADGDAFLVMDYLQGCSLGEVIDAGGPVVESEALNIIRQTCLGLAHAHKKGIIHRDLKPANLVLTTDEDESILVKIVDFGIAKITTHDDSPSQHLTRTGEVFGSPLYMSPEQWSGESLDHRSDIYSLGCLIYEMLAGFPPLVGETPLDTMTLHLNENPLTFKEFNPNLKISDQMEAIVLKCLSKNKEKRYGSVLELMRDLPAAAEAQPEIQGETVAIRLVDILDKEDKSKTTAVRKATDPKTTVTKSKSKFRWSYQKRARIFGTALVLLLSFLCLYQGPDEDPGPPASKLFWQLELSIGHNLMQWQFFGLALPVLELANWHATNLDPIFGRVNYESRFQTMARLADCYNASNKPAKFEGIIAEYISLDRKRWETKAKHFLKELEKANLYIQKLKANRESIQTHLSEPVLNWAASIKAIVEIARRLDANYSYELEYQLLFKAEKVISDIYGSDFIGLAELKYQRADCLKNQDRINTIDLAEEDANTDEGIYGSIRDLYRNYLHKELGVARDKELTLKQISQEPDYIRAILKLGQWQRRRNRYLKAQKNLELALNAAVMNGSFQPDELAEFYNSYANYFIQTDQPEKAKGYLAKAKQVRQTCAKSMGFDYIEHHQEDSSKPGDAINEEL